MNHYLVTRFNLKIKSWGFTRSGNSINNADWLNHRFLIFEKYCLPSVVNQTNKNFKWLLFFDITSDLECRNKIEQLVQKHKFIEVLYCNGMEEFLSSLKSFIKLDITNSSSLLTSRLDNDDILHKDFIKTVQQFAVGRNNKIIDSSHGSQMWIKDHKVYFNKYVHPFSQFLSFYEMGCNPETVLSRPHNEWVNSKNLVVVNDKPSWIELLHENNKLNNVRSYMYLTTHVNLLDYSLELKNNPAKYLEVLMINLKKRIMINFRLIKSLVKKLIYE